MKNQTNDALLAINAEATHKKQLVIRSSGPLSFNKAGRSRLHVVCRRFFICILFVTVVALSSIHYADSRHSSSTSVVCHSNECLRSAATFKQSMNISVDPCDDFYSYVCGHWANDHPLPKRQVTHSWSHELQTKIDRIIRDLLASNVSRSDPKPVAQTKDMYKACVSSLEVTDRHQFRVVRKYLRNFGLPSIPTLLKRAKAPPKDYKFDWISSVAKIQRKLGIDVLIGLNFIHDEQNSDRVRLTIGNVSSRQLDKFPAYVWSSLKPSNLALRTSNKKPNTKRETKDRKQHWYPGELAMVAITLSSLVTLVNPVNEAKVHDVIWTVAEKLQAFYKQLPEVKDESEDEEPKYYTVAELQNITDSHITPRKPYPIWQHYLDVFFTDLPDIKPVAVEMFLIEPKNLEYLGKLVSFISNQSPELIELYIWKTVTEYLIDHPFNKFSSEKECIGFVQQLMGLAVSYAITDRNFLKKTKPKLEQMFNEIRSEFNQMVLEADWMDTNTKNASIEKSNAMKAFIGLPEWILMGDKLKEHYRGLQVDQFHHFENWVKASQMHVRQNLQFLHVNMRDIWYDNPMSVNAYNNINLNVIDVRMGELQYPYYYLGLEALNYGALGFTLGHELTHGFDDSGRYFDKFGNHEQTWSNHSLQEFDERTSCLVEQYDSYYLQEAKDYVNGTLTLAENIADNGGLREAFRAYRTYFKRNGPEPLLPDFEKFTHEQLFFISFANRHCETISEDYAGELLTETHSPSKFRVIGVLSNMEEFSEVFQCPRGSKMNPEKKCRVW